jgi:adenosylcobyric acid synthase
MFVGTGSDVGKSVVNAAFCRIFKQDGYSPAPFKAQNMSLNSYATVDNLEIGRAQAMQAEACKIECSVEMNPVLLKPTGDMKSQVVLNGKPIGNRSAKEYFLNTDRAELFVEAMQAFDSLDNKYNPIVAEGAGSISEINLWKKDITNMKVAQEKNASTYLVSDIDKGGVFASVYGSIMLLPKEQRDLIDGIIINKFRGDISLFEEGKKIIQELTGKPVVGVIPYFKDIFIEPEDSVVIDNKPRLAVENEINIVVIHTLHMSNFTDFDNLERIQGINLFYSRDCKEISKADIIILPGSKNTISDLQFIKEQAIDKQIKEHIANGKQLYGICGGYQMMGSKIYDPYSVEGNIPEIDGLDIIPTQTTLDNDKKTVQTKFRFLDSEDSCHGYEIHMGKTETMPENALCRMGDSYDGFYLNDKVWGSYMHGIFDNPVVIEHMIKQINADFKLDFNYKEFKDGEFDKLADFVRSVVDMDYIYKKMEL